jgi:hypothetical protein
VSVRWFSRSVAANLVSPSVRSASLAMLYRSRMLRVFHPQRSIEIAPDMLQGAPEAVCRAPLVDGVSVLSHAKEVLERRALNDGADKPPGLDLREALPEDPNRIGPILGVGGLTELLPAEPVASPPDPTPTKDAPGPSRVSAHWSNLQPRF